MREQSALKNEETRAEGVPADQGLGVWEQVHSAFFTREQLRDVFERSSRDGCG